MTITISAPLFLILIVGWTWLVAYVSRLYGKWDCATDILSHIWDSLEKNTKGEKKGEDARVYDDCK